MTHQSYFYCDPAKNNPCPKTNCRHNPAAINRECDLTTNPLYALTDVNGIPIEVEVSQFFALWDEIPDKIGD